MKAVNERATRRRPPGQVLFGEEYAMQQAIDIELQERLCQFFPVDRTRLHHADLTLERIEECPVFAFQKVGTVQPVRLPDRVGQKLAITGHPHMGQTLELGLDIVSRLVPDR